MADIQITGEDLAKEFKEHSVAEFFKKNKQMLGLVGKIRTLTTIVHEYVSNSLDACEEAKILPDIDVQIDELGNEYYEITVKDNGPGLTKETVGKAFGQLLAGTKFHRMIQMRGQQGIGCSGCTMLSTMTTGKPAHIITGTGKTKPIAVELTIDPKKNEPKIISMEELKKDFKGTVVKAKFKEVKYVNSDQSPLEYLRRTAMANPHAKIKFVDPEKKVYVFERSSKEIPRKPIEVKPHPKGATVDEIVTMAKYTDARKVSTFLKTSFDRMGDKSVDDLSKKVSFDLNKDPKTLAWEEAEEIVKAIKEMDFIAPRTDGLIPIDEQRIEKSLQSILEPEFISVLTRKPAVYSGGFPFQIEVAVAYGGKSGKENPEVPGQKRIEIMRFANRVPMLFDAGGCAITKAVQSVEWKRYGIKDLDNAPLSVFVNMISVHIPYTSAGKQAVAEEDEILEEIRLALMDVGRRTSKYISGKRKEYEKHMKRELFLKYIPEVAEALAGVTKDDSKGLEKQLEKLVLDKLKLEEAQEAAETKEAVENEEEKKSKKAKGKEKAKGPEKEELDQEE